MQSILGRLKTYSKKSGRWIDAANQIERNRVYLQSETLGYIKINSLMLHGVKWKLSVIEILD